MPFSLCPVAVQCACVDDKQAATQGLRTGEWKRCMGKQNMEKQRVHVEPMPLPLASPKTPSEEKHAILTAGGKLRQKKAVDVRVCALTISVS